jgi:predicted RNA-binding protein with PUA-like domain
MPSYWIIKSEPDVYSYAQLEKEGRTSWTGIRNFQARNNLRAMMAGDLALYYHPGDAREIVGVARIASGPGPDPTAPGEDWASVEVEPLTTLQQSVALAQLKASKMLKDFPLIKQGRLSVAPVSPDHFKHILQLGKTRLPKRT